MKQALVKYTHNLYHFRNIELQYLYQTISGLFSVLLSHDRQVIIYDSYKPFLKFSSVSNIISLQVRWTGEFYYPFRFLIKFFRIHLWNETSIFPLKRKTVADYPKYSESWNSSKWRSFTVINSKQKTVINEPVPFSLIKWDASSRWSLRPNSEWGSIETTTIGKIFLNCILNLVEL